MKLRLGFVSNSSSSSYVIVGTYLTDVSDEIMESIEKSNIDLIYIENEGKSIAGSIASRSSSDDDCVNELDVEDLQKQIVKVKENLLRVGVDPEEVKIYHMYQYG